MFREPQRGAKHRAGHCALLTRVAHEILITILRDQADHCRCGLLPHRDLDTPTHQRGHLHEGGDGPRQRTGDSAVFPVLHTQGACCARPPFQSTAPTPPTRREQAARFHTDHRCVVLHRIALNANSSHTPAVFHLTLLLTCTPSHSLTAVQTPLFHIQIRLWAGQVPLEQTTLKSPAAHLRFFTPKRGVSPLLCILDNSWCCQTSHFRQVNEYKMLFHLHSPDY